MSEFWSMGGYAFYVWTSYGIAALILLEGVFKPLWRHKQILRDMLLRRQRNNRSVSQ